MTALIRFLASSVLLALVTVSPANAERLALVVGISNYTHAPRLANPARDAELIANSLSATGFTVVRLIDPDYATLKRSMLDFGRQLRDAPTEASLFFFAGHGVQVNGQNFLIPLDANIASEDEIQIQAINVNEFLAVMNSSKSKVNIVVLDACRNNPFASTARSVVRGLAPVDAPRGTYIGYATSPGTVALDGTGDNSPYTSALAAEILRPGQAIETVFKRARARVLEATSDKQLPWETSSITGEFYFVPQGVTTQPDQATQPALPALSEPSIPDQVAALEMPAERFAAAPPSTAQICHAPDADASRGTMCVSSVLDPQFGNRYGPGNMVDGDPSTAWVEGAGGDGIGELAMIRFQTPRTIRRIRIMNGYNKSADIFSKNNRIRTLKVTVSSGASFSINLSDIGKWQIADLPEPIMTNWIAFEIDKVFRGRKYPDTAISELRVE